MCGIAGLLQTDNPPDLDMLKRMSQTLVHRGPDDQGTWHDERIALAHRRLAVVDLSPAGQQPMVSADDRWVVIYNGEIYNAESLRQQCGQTQWRGRSDTEVLLACIAHWGVQQTAERLTGMFAFAAYDRQANEIWLCRDRLGIKPLYWGWCGEHFLFASELHAFSATGLPLQIRPAAVGSFLRHGYISGPASIYEGVNKLAPGTILSLRLDAAEPGQAPIEKAYWSLQRHADTGLELEEASATSQLHELLRRAVADRMIADVPLGGFLSGGFDSSLVCALMQEQSSGPVSTFTIGFEEPRYNEARHAKDVARHLGTDHTELYVSEREMLDAIAKLPQLCDEPFADSSVLPTFLISQLARTKVTVALSGDGGDELFWGYNRYALTERMWASIARVPAPVRKLISGVSRHSLTQAITRHIPAPAWGGRKGTLNQKLRAAGELLHAPTQQAFYEDMLSHWKTPQEVMLHYAELVTPFNDATSWTRQHPFTAAMALQDTLTYLPDDILTKVDRASMLVSLEARVPLLDHRIVEFASSLPAHLRRRPGQPKYLLKQILNRYVPAQLTDRPKMGFGVPLDTWLRGPLKDWAWNYLTPSAIADTGLLNPAPVQALWHAHQQGHANNAARLWNVVMLQAWLQKRSQATASMLDK